MICMAVGVYVCFRRPTDKRTTATSSRKAHTRHHARHACISARSRSIINMTHCLLLILSSPSNRQHSHTDTRTCQKNLSTQCCPALPYAMWVRHISSHRNPTAQHRAGCPSLTRTPHRQPPLSSEDK